MKQRNKLSAFTLVELVVVVAIIGIMLSVAVPSFRTYNANSLADSTHKKLLYDISFARSSARDYSDSVQITPRNNDWNNGWVISIVNGDVLRISNGLSANVRVTSTDFDQATPITFNSEGRAVTVGDLAIVTQNCAGDRQRTIQINLMGQARTQEVACQ